MLGIGLNKVRSSFHIFAFDVSKHQQRSLTVERDVCFIRLVGIYLNNMTSDFIDIHN